MFDNTIKAAGVVMATLALISCDNSEVIFTAIVEDTTLAVESVTVTPDSAVVDTSGTVDLDADVRDTRGNSVSSRAVSWASSDTAVARVDSQGLVTAVTEGAVLISATAGGVTGTSDVTVASSSDGTLTISASVDTLYGIGDTLALSVEARNADGTVIAEPDVQWSSSDPDIATVDTMGTVISRALGTAIIAASVACCAGEDFVEVAVVDTTSAGTTAPATVDYIVASPSSHTFTQIGSTLRISATARDSLDQTVPDVEFGYSSTNASVVSVDSLGTMTANALGSASIVVTAVGWAIEDTVQATVDTTAASPLFSDDFEDETLGSETPQANSSEWSWSNNSSSSTGSLEVSNDIARSGSQSLKVTYLGENTTGNAGARPELRFVHDPVQEYWVEFYLYFPDGTEGFANKFVMRLGSSSTNNKFFLAWPETYSPLSAEGATPGGGIDFYPQNESGGVYDMKIRINSTDGADGGLIKPAPSAIFLPNDESKLGQWLRFRIHQKSVDFEQTDGRRRMWLDDVLKIDQDNIPWYPVHDDTPYLKHGYIFGAANTGFDDDTDVYMDDFKFYTSDPGWR